jgi:hypothetical protein
MIRLQKDKEIEAELEEIKDKLAYFQKLSIYDITASYFRSLSYDDQVLLLVAIQK